VIENVAVAYLAGHFAEYLFNASTETGREFDAWVLWHAARCLAELGVSTVNIGGGIRPGDGVAEYKARFHGLRRPLRSLRQVYDRAEYERLCAEAGAADGGSWFPAYRANPAPGPG
jgi:hypothetical protein